MIESLKGLLPENMDKPGVGPELFRKLTMQEEGDFRLWAHQNYKPFTSIDCIWHPIIQHECACINLTEWNKYHGKA